MTHDEYHADFSRVGHSMLEVFRESVPLYHARFVAQSVAAPAASPALLLGRALHLAVLEPALFDSQVLVAPQCDRRTKHGKGIWAEFQHAAQGKLILSRPEWEQLKAMKGALENHLLAGAYLSEAVDQERVLHWTDPDSEVACKCKLDAWLPLDGALLDVKTTSETNPRGWIRQGLRLGYHRQAAHYLQGATANGYEPQRFLFLTVCSEYPHEVCCFECAPSLLRLGQAENQELLSELAHCQETQCWDSRHASSVYSFTEVC